MARCRMERTPAIWRGCASSIQPAAPERCSLRHTVRYSKTTWLRSSHADSIEIHQALVEQIIFGADVVQAAIHLTAATLAAMSPSVGFTQMQLHTHRFGRTSRGAIELGSLDWLLAPEIQSSFSATEEQIGARSGTGTMVPLPRADLVISNPPYVRRGSDGGKGEAIARVFPLPQGDLDARKAISQTNVGASERNCREPKRWTWYVFHGPS